MTLKSVCETLKKDGQRLMSWIYKKLTKTQIGIASVVLTAIVLVLFLCTQTGRNVISFIALVGFGLVVVYGGYRLFIHTTSRATGISKSEREKPVEDYREDVVPKEAGEQMTFDSLVANEEEQKDDTIDEDADNI